MVNHSSRAASRLEVGLLRKSGAKQVFNAIEVATYDKAEHG